jgi:hypothetical protein
MLNSQLTQTLHRYFSCCVPARGTAPRLAAFSCNHEVVNRPSLWNGVLAQHESQPFHVLVGGGDQIYNVSYVCEPAQLS